MGKDVIVALDFPTEARALAFLEAFGAARPYVKVGMELFYAAGPQLVRRLKERRHSVFLDLKLHDIPNTVGSAMRVLAGLGANMVNLHAAGGSAMMRAGLEGLRQGAEEAGMPRPLLIAVTQLTSTSTEALRDELLIGQPMAQVVESYARTAQAAGLDGVVCSPLEIEAVKGALGGGFLAVTPGIRFPDGEKGDQARVTSPAAAKALGGDYIVVGRPITRAENPAAAYARCVAEFVGGKA